MRGLPDARTRSCPVHAAPRNPAHAATDPGVHMEALNSDQQPAGAYPGGRLKYLAAPTSTQKFTTAHKSSGHPHHHQCHIAPPTGTSMSALAARRAAQEALASKSASASPAASPAPAPRKKAPKAPSPDLEAEYDTVVLQSDSGSEEDDAPPKRRRVGDGGRGRGGKGRPLPREKAASKESKLRYYAPPEPAHESEPEEGSNEDTGPDSDTEADKDARPVHKGSGKRPRRFSFSAPNDMSSGGEDAGEDEDDSMPDARTDGAATPWSVQSPGPSQFR